MHSYTMVEFINSSIVAFITVVHLKFRLKYFSYFPLICLVFNSVWDYAYNIKVLCYNRVARHIPYFAVYSLHAFTKINFIITILKIAYNNYVR